MEHISGGRKVKDYAVAFVGDDALPEGVDWAFIKCDCTLIFAVKEHAVSAALLAEAWGTFRELPVLAA